MDKTKMLEQLARGLVAAAGLPIPVGTTNDNEVTIGDYLLWPSREEYGHDEMVEHATIAGTDWYPGYCVGRIKVYAATQWEPEDMDLQVLEVYRSPLQAILEAVGWSASELASRHYESLPWNEEPYLSMLRANFVPLPEHLAFQYEAYAP